MLYYRRDLFENAGITVPANPTYEQVGEWQKKVNDPSNRCLRHVLAW